MDLQGVFADIMRPLVGEGLLTSEGDTWKLHHKLALSSFQVIVVSGCELDLTFPAFQVQTDHNSDGRKGGILAR